MMEEGEGEEKDAAHLLNSIIKGGRVAAAASWILSSSGVDNASSDGNTGNGLSGFGGVAINSRLDAGINSTLNSMLERSAHF